MSFYQSTDPAFNQLNESYHRYYANSTDKAEYIVVVDGSSARAVGYLLNKGQRYYQLLWHKNGKALNLSSADLGCFVKPNPALPLKSYDQFVISELVKMAESVKPVR